MEKKPEEDVETKAENGEHRSGVAKKEDDGVAKGKEDDGVAKGKKDDGVAKKEDDGSETHPDRPPPVAHQVRNIPFHFSRSNTKASEPF